MALRLTYKDNQSSLKELLEKDHFVIVHQKKLQVLVTETLKVKNDVALMIPPDVRKCKTLNEIKTKFKSWYPNHCVGFTKAI